jgi:hypothetical protein
MVVSAGTKVSVAPAPTDIVAVGVVLGSHGTTVDGAASAASAASFPLPSVVGESPGASAAESVLASLVPLSVVAESCAASMPGPESVPVSP